MKKTLLLALTCSITANLVVLPAVLADAVSWDKTSKAATEAANKKDYDTAVTLYKQALDDAKGSGLEAKFIALTMSDLANVYRNQGKTTEAESLLKEGLALKEKAYGSMDPTLVSSLANLGQFYKNTGRLPEASAMLERASAIQEKKSGPNSVLLVPLLNAQAGVAMSAGNDDQALKLLNRVVDLAKGSNDKATQIISMNNLATVLRRQGKTAEAEALLAQVVQLQANQKPVGKNEADRGQNSDHNKAAALTQLARVRREKGEFDKAKPLLLQAYNLLTAKGTTEPIPAQIVAIDNLATCCKEMGDYAEAVKYYRQALALQGKVGDTTPEAKAARLTNLALALVASGDTTESEGLLVNSVSLMEQQYGKDSDKIAPALSNLAEIYRIENRFTDAEPALIRTLEIRKKALGNTDPKVGETTSDLAVLYKQMGKDSDSLKYFEESVAVRESTPDTPELATALLNLAKAYRQSGQYDKSEALYKRALTIREKNFGANDQQVAAVLRNYAILLKAMGRKDEAKALDKRALKIEEVADN